MFYVCSTKEPVLAVVQGPSPHGDLYRTIAHKRGATEVVYVIQTPLSSHHAGVARGEGTCCIAS